MNNQNGPSLSPADQKLLESALRSAPFVTCDECGNGTFQEVVMFKMLSALVSPTGKAGMVPMPVMACNACGHVNESFLPPVLKNITEAPASAPTTPLKLEK